MSKTILAILATLLAVPGCANTLLSDDRIRGNTALALNDPNVTISNRRYDGMTNTYYTARTSHGSYACTMNGGSILAAGMTNPPQCTRQ